jgi:phosphotriesterase-related protein
MRIDLINERIAGKVQTVLGLIDPADMGVTITHEHLLVDEAHLYHEPEDPEARKTFHAPLDMAALSRMYYAGHDNLESTTMLDEALAIEEASHFKRLGGSTLVEVTPIGIARTPQGLRRIAKATGLNVVMGCSYYVDESLPPEIAGKSQGEITDELITEIFVGADGGEVRPGLIGEVGCSWPMTELEERVVRASARAQKLTGAPLMIHPGRDANAPIEIVKILEEEGADLERTIICHIDRTILEPPQLVELASTGVVLEYDLFGHEHSHYVHNLDVDQPNDAERLRYIRYLMDAGFGGQIVVSQDCDNKIYLRKYGGCGYAHIIENVVPKALRRGFTRDEIDQLLIHTPRRLFTFAAPER